MTGLSNWGSLFVCNKTCMGGGGLAEGCRQRATEVGFANLDRSAHGYGRSLTMTV